MRIEGFHYYRQVIFIAFSLFVFSCERSSGEILLIPPPTNPMVREYLGFGVVNVSFIHVLEEPFEEAAGYLRKGSLVKITERRSLSGSGGNESWVKVETSTDTQDADIQGWLRESSIMVYDNEVRAMTAAGTMLP